MLECTLEVPFTMLIRSALDVWLS